MEAVIASIQALSGSEADLSQLSDTLKQHEDVFVQHAGQLNEALSILDPAIHSLGWLYVLYAKTKENNPDAQSSFDFLVQVQRFLLSCSRNQISLAPDRFVVVCKRFAQGAIHTQQPKRAIRPLEAAVLKFQPSPEHLTPIHSEFLLVCLVAKFYSAALTILEQDIFEVNPGATGLVARDLLLYFYYGGLIFVGLKRFKDALDSFQQAFTAPATVLSAIMVESYKKYILIALLVHGQVPPMPKYTSSNVQRHLKTAAAQYLEFANAYNSQTLSQVQACAETHADKFVKDNNMGLIKQCIASIHRRNIQRLTQTYLTLSLTDIADTVKLSGPREAETHVLKMIEAGEIYATIDQRDGMVCFLEDPEQYDSNTTLEKMDANIHMTMSLAAKLQRVHDSISSDPAYLSKVSVQERQARYDPDEANFDLGTVDKPPGFGFVSQPAGARAALDM